jgi:hypothetical protein
MPKLFGLNLVAVLVASVVFYLIGWVWYGMVFSDAWMAAHGITEETGGGEPIWMFGGFIVSVLQVIGLGLVLKWKGVADPQKAVIKAAILWLCFALPLTMYSYVYLSAHDSTLLMIDSGYLLVGWAVSAIVLVLIK